jgi:hypothetical protein
VSHPDHERAPYWQADVALGEGTFFRGETYGIRMRLHEATGRYFGRHEIVPLSRPAGERTYVHAKPYILVPDVTLTVGLSRQPDAGGAIGAVTGSEWRGMRHEEIGQAQGWYYPSDRLVVLWECFPEERYRTSDDPRQDTTLGVLWDGFERWLGDRFVAARQLVTTYEDMYDRPAWQAFLEERGYRPMTPVAFVKERTPSTTATTEHAP